MFYCEENVRFASHLIQFLCKLYTFTTLLWCNLLCSLSNVDIFESSYIIICSQWICVCVVSCGTCVSLAVRL